jgi:hypothetical protein
LKKKKLKKIEKKSRKKMSWCSDAPEDEAISLFAGLLANPDMTLSLQTPLRQNAGEKRQGKELRVLYVS